MSVKEEEGARHTLYINNLNEKVKIAALKEELTQLCAAFGPVLAVVARDTLRTRGQAFVVFADESAAAAARTALSGKDFHGKPLRVAFARTKSDAIAQRDGTLDERRARRALLKERRIAEEKIARKAAKRARREVEAAVAAVATAVASDPSATAAAAAAAAVAAAGGGVGVPPPATYAGTFAPLSGAPGVAAAAAAAAAVPAAPTAVFVDSLPADATAAVVRALLERLGAAQQLKECQMVPGKPGLAFVEFCDGASAAAAVQRLNGHVLDAEHTLRAMPAMT